MSDTRLATSFIFSPFPAEVIDQVFAASSAIGGAGIPGICFESVIGDDTPWGVSNTLRRLVYRDRDPDGGTHV